MEDEYSKGTYILLLSDEVYLTPGSLHPDTKRAHLGRTGMEHGVLHSRFSLSELLSSRSRFACAPSQALVRPDCGSLCTGRSGFPSISDSIV